MNLLDELKYELHDLPLDSVELNFQSEEVTFHVRPYDDVECAYRKVDLTFQEVNTLKWNQDVYLSNAEVYDFDVEELENRCQLVKITMLHAIYEDGQHKTTVSSSIEFECGDLKIDDFGVVEDE